MEQIILNGEVLIPKYTKYSNGGICIELYTTTGKLYMVATTNIGNLKFADHYVGIKNWSENAGVLEALIQANIVKDPNIFVPSGFIEIPICELVK